MSIRSKIPVVLRSSHQATMNKVQQGYEAELESLRTEIASSQADSLDHVNRLLNQVSRLELALSDAKRSLRKNTTALRADRNRLLAESQRLRATHNILQSETNALRILAEERNTLAAQTERLIEREENLQRALEKSETKKASAERECKKLEAELDRLSAAEQFALLELKSAESHRVTLENQLTKATEENANLAQQSSDTQHKLSKAESDLVAALLAADTHKNEHERLIGVESQLRKELARSENGREQLAEKLSDFSSENAELAQREYQTLQKLSQTQLDVAAEKLRADSFKNECERLGKSEAEILNTLAHTESVRDTLKRQLTEFETERETLDALMSESQNALAQAELEIATAKLEAERFKKECERLGDDSVRMLHENASLAMQLEQRELERREFKQRLRFAYDRSPLMIGTFPRSGTWMLKYFMHFLDFYSRENKSPSIQSIFEAVTNNELYDLRFLRGELPPQLITISHWMCPGVFNLPDNQIGDLKETLEKLGSLQYQKDQIARNDVFDPIYGRSRIIFVYRNPFDVYRSYADIFERRASMIDRQDYPFNPMAPFGTQLMNSVTDRPFDHFIEGFKESNFTEFFAAYFMSFLLVQDEFPENVQIVRFEDAMADRTEYLRNVVTHGRVGQLDDLKFRSAFENAIKATEIEQMKRYEAELGHAISGAKTFYGEANPTHLSTKKRDWQSLFSESDLEFLRAKLSEIAPRVLDYLPEIDQLNSAP